MRNLCGKKLIEGKEYNMMFEHVIVHEEDSP
jgi:hypothetical protein